MKKELAVGDYVLVDYTITFKIGQILSISKLNQYMFLIGYSKKTQADQKLVSPGEWLPKDRLEYISEEEIMESMLES